MHYIPLLYVAFAARFMFQTNSSGPLAEQIPPIHAKSTYSNTCCKCAANELCKVPEVFFFPLFYFFFLLLKAGKGLGAPCLP